MDNYDFKKIVSKLGIALLTTVILSVGNVMISQINAGARRVRTHHVAKRSRVHHRHTKGIHVKRAKRVRWLSKRLPKRRGRKLVSRVKPRKMKIEYRGTDDPVSVRPKKK